MTNIWTNKYFWGFIIVIAIIIISIIYSRRPQIRIIPNWEEKTFKYKLRVAGCSFNGERSMIDNRPILDQASEDKTCGKYSFSVHKDGASIWEEGKGVALKAMHIDIDRKDIYEVQSFH